MSGPPPALMPSRVGLQGTANIRGGGQPAVRGFLRSDSEGPAVREAMEDIETVLEEDTATQAEGAAIHLC